MKYRNRMLIEGVAAMLAFVALAALVYSIVTVMWGSQ